MRLETPEAQKPCLSRFEDIIITADHIIADGRRSGLAFAGEQELPGAAREKREVLLRHSHFTRERLEVRPFDSYVHEPGLARKLS